MPNGHVTGKTFTINSGGFTTLWELKLVDSGSSIFIDESWFVKATGGPPWAGMGFAFSGSASLPVLVRAPMLDTGQPPVVQVPQGVPVTVSCSHGSAPDRCLFCGGVSRCAHGVPKEQCLQCVSPLAPVLPLRKPGTLNIMLTCDWEGRENVQSYYDNMRVLRAGILKLCGKALPITHFITPRSYDATLKDVIARGDVVLPVDEIGLHIHCWTDLLAKMGAEVIEEGKDCRRRYPFTQADGKDTPLTAFSKEGIQRIVTFCHARLEEISGRKARSFRGGAWFANDAAYAALASCGVVNDSSPIPPALSKYPDKSILDAIQGLWGAKAGMHGNVLTWVALLGEPVTVTTQPYRLTTAQGALQVFPMTWGMDVNATKEQILGWLAEEAVKVLSGEDRFVNLGFHDTLSQNGWLLGVLDAMGGDLQRVPHRFVTLEEAGELAAMVTARTG